MTAVAEAKPLPNADQVNDALAAVNVAFAILAQHDWDGIRRAFRRDHTLMPLLDPTAYQRVLRDPGVPKAEAAVRAAAEFVGVLEKEAGA